MAAVPVLASHYVWRGSQSWAGRAVLSQEAELTFQVPDATAATSLGIPRVISSAREVIEQGFMC